MLKIINQICILLITILLFVNQVYSQTLPDFLQLEETLKKSTLSTVNNGGIYKPGQAWAAIVNREGKVLAIAKVFGSDPWPAGRELAVIKAFTANSFSNKQFALSTANLYNIAQPNKSMFGIQNSIPVNPQLYAFDQESYFGTQNDPLAIHKIKSGGISVIAGGLPIYNQFTGEMIGAIGVSGDSPCASHFIAWRIRHALGFTKIPAGPNHSFCAGAIPPEKGDDNIIFDESHTFGYPFCDIGEITVNDLPTMENF